MIIQSCSNSLRGLAGQVPDQAQVMRDAAYELPRTYLLGTSVNNLPALDKSTYLDPYFRSSKVDRKEHHGRGATGTGQGKVRRGRPNRPGGGRVIIVLRLGGRARPRLRGDRGGLDRGRLLRRGVGRA